MVTYSYVVPDPSTPGRLTVFFTRGLLEPGEDADLEMWQKIFETRQTSPKKEKAQDLATKMLLGTTVEETIQEDGAMAFRMSTPLGAHGMTYVDFIYTDESLIIMKGQTGTLYVLSRVPPQLVG